MRKSNSFKICNNCGYKSERNSLMRGGTTLPPEYFGAETRNYVSESNHQSNEGFGHNLSSTNKNFIGGSYTRKRVPSKSRYKPKRKTKSKAKSNKRKKTTRKKSSKKKKSKSRK
jgi:hypothetical protein